MGCMCCSNKSSEKHLLRVVVFGLENSGKTSLVNCLKSSSQSSEDSSYTATHGVIATNANPISPNKIDLLLFDCGGCKHQRHIWPHLSNDSDLILFVVDSFDYVCLPDAKEALHDLLEDESLISKPLLIVFNKSDQAITMNMSDMETALDLSSIEGRLIHQVCCSSVTLHGFDLILEWLNYFRQRKASGKSICPLNNPFLSKDQLSYSLKLTQISTSSRNRLSSTHTSLSLLEKKKYHESKKIKFNQ